MRKPIGSALVGGALVVLAACSNASTSGENDAGSPDRGLVDEAPVVASFEVTPAEGLGQGGGEVTLSWAVAGADSIAIDPGVGVVEGTETSASVTESTIFTLTASNDQGSSDATAVAFVAPADPTAFDLTATSIEDQIDDAVAEGAIDDVTALRYKVFALHDDERLPPEYDAEGPMHGTAIMFGKQPEQPHLGLKAP